MRAGRLSPPRRPPAGRAGGEVQALSCRQGRKNSGAAKLDEIFAALKEGGYHFGDSDGDAKAGLKIALGKDGKVRALPNGAYGLWEWYPDAKRPKARGDKETGDKGEKGGADGDDAEQQEGEQQPSN